ncbi:MAG: aminotransferase class I/II-fold pyridoxal phosphate-dependent enzyme [Campylobacter sputorum]|uniref:aminotransferase class I/II-fold pyridoxal phosphate-dependent enzyme n=1 Tax=Campylobacter sputorum TaxID=206 RepID=UPI000B77BD79|nr:aminotransferase class I/II-fold pyridoxal phosphate-dependent enzyme [Campylobacter sputorum]ASM38147.1 8-amino-7-oxononanoate synthase [Campylobacter sputorum bv. paraureolyticus LMG 11764]MDY6121295.1 aminotransferase class I/II-fold pyridoxal phosphate-dependent enzyme [Campylobacter sputorum]
MFDIEYAKNNDNFRELKHSQSVCKFIYLDGKKLLNLGSNDYLGIATNTTLKDEFLEISKNKDYFFGSGASRLVYTSSDEFNKLESYFEQRFCGKKATIFNTGYCANLSCISALNGKQTLFLCDKLIHASMIDALKISKAKFKRYEHNNYEMLNDLLLKNYSKFDEIIILSESVFSMDGDSADIRHLCELKKEYKNVKLYIDEAHSFFVRNELGNAHKLGLDKDIDFLLVTLGKGIGSSGAVILSNAFYKDIFVNSARSLIFSTAIPSICVAWTNFILSKDFSLTRQNLEQNIAYLGLNGSHIQPFLTYENSKTLELSKKLIQNGYFIPAIRPPTVAPNTSRLRISLRGDVEKSELKMLKEILYAS